MNKQELISQSDFIISFGTMLNDNKEPIRDAVIESIAKTNAAFTYMHPIDNIDLKLYYTQFIKYEVGSEEGICSMLLDTFVKTSNEKIQNYIEDLDLGYISAESSAGEEEFEELYENCKDKENISLLIGDDIIEHERVDSIVKFLAVIKKYTNLNIIVLNEDLQKRIDSCEDENLEELEELKSFNGTLLYRLFEEENSKELICSQAFANIAKVKDKDEINISYKGQKVQKTLKIDEKLHGTIALAKVKEGSVDAVFNEYRYKQVKIEKVDA